MKITIDVDLTPAEAREMLGMPNIQKVQEAFLKQIEKKMTDEIKNLSPEKIMKSWMSGASTNMDWLPGMLSGFASGGKNKS